MQPYNPAGSVPSFENMCPTFLLSLVDSWLRQGTAVEIYAGRGQNEILNVWRCQQDTVVKTNHSLKTYTATGLAFQNHYILSLMFMSSRKKRALLNFFKVANL